MVYFSMIFYVVFLCYFVLKSWIANPRSPMSFGSIIPDQYINSFVQILNIAVNVHGTILIYTMLCVFHTCTVTYGVLSTSFISKEFYVSRKLSSKNETINSFRKSQNIIRFYRSIQVLHKSFLRVVGPTFVPLHCCSLKLTIFCNFVIIRHYETTPRSVIIILAIWSLACTLVWGLILEKGGYTYKCCERTMNSWKIYDWGSRRSNAIISKFIRSCKLFTWNFGGSYKMGRFCVLKFLNGLGKGTFRALLTLEEVDLV